MPAEREREMIDAAPPVRPRRYAAHTGFTLVELLVVVTVIVLLLAITLPSLASAIEAAGRAVCASNLKQSGLALFTYAADHHRHLPPACPNTGYDASIMRLTTSSWDLRPPLESYLSNFAAWHCPALPQAAEIDDERNTRHAAYGTYDYYAGRLYPTFDDAAAHPATITAPRASDTVLMQDKVFDAPFYPGQLRVNHGAGALTIPLPANNPALAYYIADEAYGVNAMHFDQHVEWGDDLVPVGPISAGLVQQSYSIAR